MSKIFKPKESCSDSGIPCPACSKETRLKGVKLKNGEPATPASLCTRIEFEYID